MQADFFHPSFMGSSVIPCATIISYPLSIPSAFGAGPVRKRATAAVACLAPTLSDPLLEGVIQALIAGIEGGRPAGTLPCMYAPIKF